MRNRAWRRHIEDKKVIKRIKSIASRRYSSYSPYNPIDYVGTKLAHLYKNNTTSKSDSKYKAKYSPNKSEDFYNLCFRKTRLFNKNELQRELKENGITWYI